MSLTPSKSLYVTVSLSLSLSLFSPFLFAISLSLFVSPSLSLANVICHALPLVLCHSMAERLVLNHNRQLLAQPPDVTTPRGARQQCKSLFLPLSLFLRLSLHLSLSLSLLRLRGCLACETKSALHRKGRKHAQRQTERLGHNSTCHAKCLRIFQEIRLIAQVIYGPVLIYWRSERTEKSFHRAVANNRS